MPWACKTICTKPGCGVLVPKPGLCAVHLAELRKDQNDRRAKRQDPSDKFYHTAQWQRLRASVLTAQPLCRTCEEQGLVVAAILVDHIVPVKDGGPMWDTANLQPLCNLCHERKSVDEGGRFVPRRGRGGLHV
jgi:5-methylcytosine-specific restriction protein A